MCIKILLAVSLLLQSSLITMDKIAAVVNEQVITVSDIEKAIALYPFMYTRNETDETFYRRVLEELINYTVIDLEYRNEFTLSEDDYEYIQTPILKKARSMEALLALLQEFDMEEKDFREFIRPRVLYEKVLREKFPFNINIPSNDIEDFYNREYVPAQQRLQLEPLSLVEMTPVIERYLRKSKTEERLSGWLNDIKSAYKIEIKLRSVP